MLMSVGVLSGIAVLMAVVSAVMYGIFSVVAVYPQHTNIVKETTTEQELRKIRMEAVISKMILAAVMFGITIIFGF